MIRHIDNIPGLAIYTPEIFNDTRGVFRRNFCVNEFIANGIDFEVKQGNISENYNAFTLRGFHYQKSPSCEGKILTPITGEIFNVVIDLRKTLNSYLNVVALNVSALKKESLHVPSGCANAYLTLQSNTIIHYYMSDFFKPESYSGFRYDSKSFSINWPHEPVVISERDLSLPEFSESDS